MHQGPHSKSRQRRLWAPSWVLMPEATQLWLRGMGRGPLGALLLPCTGLRRRVIWLGWELGLSRGREGHGTWSEPTHFWSTKMPMMNVKEIRSAVTHMRQYSSGGCGQMARGQPRHGRFTPGSRLRVHGQEDLSPLGRGRGRRGGAGTACVCVYACVHVYICTYRTYTQEKTSAWCSAQRWFVLRLEGLCA